MVGWFVTCMVYPSGHGLIETLQSELEDAICSIYDNTSVKLTRLVEKVNSQNELRGRYETDRIALATSHEPRDCKPNYKRVSHAVRSLNDRSISMSILKSTH